MSEFPSIETLTAAKNAVERDRVIRETWEALVAAVEEYDKVARDADIYDYWAMEEIAAQQGMVSEKAIAYVKARQGANNEHR